MDLNKNVNVNANNPEYEFDDKCPLNTILTEKPCQENQPKLDNVDNIDDDRYDAIKVAVKKDKFEPNTICNIYLLMVRTMWSKNR